MYILSPVSERGQNILASPLSLSLFYFLRYSKISLLKLVPRTLIRSRAVSDSSARRVIRRLIARSLNGSHLFPFTGLSSNLSLLMAAAA
jgi:hypothetical protein